MTKIARKLNHNSITRLEQIYRAISLTVRLLRNNVGKRTLKPQS